LIDFCIFLLISGVILTSTGSVNLGHHIGVHAGITGFIHLPALYIHLAQNTFCATAQNHNSGAVAGLPSEVTITVSVAGIDSKMFCNTLLIIGLFMNLTNLGNLDNIFTVVSVPAAHISIHHNSGANINGIILAINCHHLY